jgi:hypothetical protein
MIILIDKIMYMHSYLYFKNILAYFVSFLNSNFISQVVWYYYPHCTGKVELWFLQVEWLNY